MEKERAKLISDLRRVRKNKFQLNDGEKAMEFIPLMLEYMGDTDPEFRDDLINSTLCNWICEKDYFSNEELIQILHTVLDDNHLLFHIGNENDDTVFTRTFSALIIESILWKHRNNPYLHIDDWTKAKDISLKYYNEEKDLRGYMEDKGWAHGAAHGADVMYELAVSKECDEETLLKILDSIQHVLYNGKYMFSNEEDERIARVVFDIVMKGLLSKQKIFDWIKGLAENIPSEYSREQQIQRVNTKNFIRSIYFSLMHQQNTKDVTDVLFDAEAKLNRFI